MDDDPAKRFAARRIIALRCARRCGTRATPCLGRQHGRHHGQRRLLRRPGSGASPVGHRDADPGPGRRRLLRSRRAPRRLRPSGWCSRRRAGVSPSPPRPSSSPDRLLSSGRRWGRATRCASAPRPCWPGAGLSQRRGLRLTLAGPTSSSPRVHRQRRPQDDRGRMRTLLRSPPRPCSSGRRRPGRRGARTGFWARGGPVRSHAFGGAVLLGIDGVC